MAVDAGCRATQPEVENRSAADGPRRGRPAWLVVAGRELRDLWLGGRALVLLLAYSIMLSVTTYLTATNEALNFLEQREAVSLTLQVAVAVGVLLSLLAAADAISGERERGSLESLLLAPIPRWSLTVGKGLAALTLWLAAFVVSAPYVWYLGRGVKVVTTSLVNGFLVGCLLALAMTGLGLVISTFAASNRVSLSVSVFVLLALFAPTQMPSSAQRGWFGDLLLRVDPFTAALRYLGRIIINARTFAQEGHWLVGPAIVAGVLVVAAVAVSTRLRLGTGGRG
ncbi:ABC-2 type transporter [Kribbella flavida DSM 17836]|uniref:ABC-2 type transporter n=1 Tax=Kribbella flavida (strain DSM 17836 / JCM 10339 / NBRC 14399) TaxID=479435 RepID=D2PLY8_KRIFD|nr:ABC transporter permease subunit [Kribbella flavida]ADB32568.1 ABC-2 type transporter [Kribbella flavida DSM 17836]